jgi:YD repeat-containing protein
LELAHQPFFGRGSKTKTALCGDLAGGFHSGALTLPYISGFERACLGSGHRRFSGGLSEGVNMGRFAKSFLLYATWAFASHRGVCSVRTSSFFAVVAFTTLATMAASTHGRTEAVDSTRTWVLYGVTSGAFSSPDAVVDAYNAEQEREFAACSARSCSSCINTIHRSGSYSVLNLPATVINGAVNSLRTTTAQKTSYRTACSVGGVDYPPEGPTTTTVNESIGIASRQHCPFFFGGTGRSLGQTTIEGYTINVQEHWCVRELPDPPRQCPIGNPIDPQSRSKIASETDYRSPDGLLAVSRSYSSSTGRWTWGHEVSLADFTGRSASRPQQTQRVAYIRLSPPAVYSAPPPVDRPMVFTLRNPSADGSQKMLQFTSPNGIRTDFIENPDGSFVPRSTEKYQLHLGTNASGELQWRMRLPGDGFDVFDAAGNRIQHVMLDGKSVTYSRASDALTVTAQPGGRSLRYTRSNPTTPAWLFDTVGMPDANQLRYGISGSALVDSVTYPGGANKQYLYNEAAFTGISSPGAGSPSWLTGLIDENNARHATYRYDGTTPLSTELAGAANKHVFGFAGSTAAGATTVTMPLPNAPQVTYNWEADAQGEPRLRSKSQPAGAGCNASTSAMSYDANGNVSSADDFNGNRTCYAHDLSRNVESARVEGLAGGSSCSVTAAGAALPAGARKISTEWHPDWRLETRIAEPKKLTTHVYNGQPDPSAGGAVAACAPANALLPDGKPIVVLCKKIEQATSDASGAQGFAAAAAGAARTWSYTYNPWGQKLTERDPRGNTTTYAYYASTSFTGADPDAVGHTVGDLQSMTNAAGHVTQYPLYDKNGRVRRMVDANGTTTDTAYTPRGWVSSVTVTPAGGVAQLSRYVYDGVGQLKEATLADLTKLSYTYDDAHRLTQVTDGAGNTMNYTLDAMGNRTREDIKDPGDALRRSITRVYDALNRLQSVTGSVQ